MSGENCLRNFLSRARRNATSVLLALVCGVLPLLAQQSNLSSEQQTAFLAQRGGSIPNGTFDSVRSFLFTFHSIAIHTNSDRINAAGITPTFPSFYKPTWRELFDMIAWQTRSRWNYDPEQGYWVFRDERPTMPYTLTTASGWLPQDHSIEVVYRPPKLSPVGMDVYWLGSYSADGEDAANLFRRVREEQAMHFVRGYVKGVSLEQMKKTRIGSVETLYYETRTERGPIWRQWVIVEKGQAFAMVSAIRPEHEKELLPDVLGMVHSFAVADPPPAPPARSSTAEEKAIPLVRVALSLANGIHPQNFTGYQAIPMFKRDWSELAKDSDLGPFLRFKEKDPGQLGIVLMKDDRSPIFCVYFEKEAPSGVVAVIERKAATLNTTDLESGYTAVTPGMPKLTLRRLSFDTGTIETDNGQSIAAFRITGAEFK